MEFIVFSPELINLFLWVVHGVVHNETWVLAIPQEGLMLSNKSGIALGEVDSAWLTCVDGRWLRLHAREEARLSEAAAQAALKVPIDGGRSEARHVCTSSICCEDSVNAWPISHSVPRRHARIEVMAAAMNACHSSCT